MAEIQASIEMLDEVEDIAFGFALRVPPALALVVDDENLALAAAIFEAMFRALSRINPPWRRLAFEHDGAMHFLAQLFYFRVGSGHPCAPARGLRAGRPATARLRLILALMPSGDREAVALQGRGSGAAETREAARRTDPLTARPALAERICLLLLFSPPFCQRRLRE